MIARLRHFVFHYKLLRAFLVIVLCIGALTSILARSTNGLLADISENVRRSDMFDSSSIAITWEFGSAHGNVQSLVWRRQISRVVHEDVLLLVARHITPILTLVLPLLALFTALALVRVMPTSPTPCSANSRALTHGLLCPAIPVVVGLFLVIESRTLGIPLPWTQWSRVLIWLTFVGIYFTAFLLLGSWISHRVKRVRTAAWIFLSLFVALFMIQSSRELLMRFDGSHLPPVPELPTEVRLSLFRPSGEPRVTPDREEMVAEYLESVDSYSEAVHDIVRHRYQLERWWHALSPQLLLTEISTQLLQTQHADIPDVIYSQYSGEPGLMASLTSIWPETSWLILLCGLSGLGAWITVRKKMSAP